MIDLKIDASGDWEIDEGTKDLKLTGSTPALSEDIAKTVAQLAYFGLKTDLGDLSIHPEVGNDIAKLMGLPNKPSTAASGEKYIRAALASMSILNDVSIESWPEDLNTIAYEIKITVGNPPKVMKMTIRQSLQPITTSEG